jgi:hypothetical protein
MLEVKKGLDDLAVPIRYWQWDDWWYSGHHAYVYCVDEWELQPPYFSSTLGQMREKLGTPPPTPAPTAPTPSTPQTRHAPPRGI